MKATNVNLVDSQDDVVKIKCVVVGDGNVGKTCLIETYAYQVFSPYYGNKIINVNHSWTIVLEDGHQPVQFFPWDTDGDDDECYGLRQLSYRDTDVFLVCYSLTDQASYTSVLKKWLREISKNCPGVPAFVVATKCDLKVSPDNNSHSEKDRDQDPDCIVVPRYGEFPYYECSALQMRGVKELFEEAAQIGYEYQLLKAKRKSKHKCCNIL